MTVMEPVYTSDRGMQGHIPYQGTELDVADAMPWVEAAAARAIYKIYATPTYDWDARLDKRSLLDTAEQFVNGFKGEAAFAMHYGQSLDGMLEGDWGKPDFTVHGEEYDVKTAFTGRAPYLNIRAYIAQKKMWLVGAKSTVGATRVTLLGMIHSTDLAHYPVEVPAWGHDKEYIRVPFGDLHPLAVL
jgi:hypothetical protein